MGTRARAWFLTPGKPSDIGTLAEMVPGDLDLPAPSGDQILAEPLFGAWGANMTHALERKPLDICRHRGEERVVLGNAAVVRVLEAGPDAQRFRPGQVAMIFSASVVDRWGYPEKMLAYDAPGTMGCMATRMLLRAQELIPIPDGTRHSLAQWAAFSGNYATAWSNWQQAYGSFRLLVGADECPAPHVWGWGGGTTFATLDLARRAGAQTVMVSASPIRQALITAAGITPISRHAFGELSFDERRSATDPTYRKAYVEAEARFLAEVDRRTNGDKVQIFVDYIGTPVLRATMKALGREGIITTAGWREGMVVQYLRAAECIARHQLVHTHYARYPQVVAAMAYGEAEGWMPPVDERIYGFDELPELSRRYAAGEGGFFTVFRVNA
jgi:NADPH:quinone reductase-like Zn-dependent oxidoreductase